MAGVKEDMLESIRSQIETDGVCRVLKEQATQLVFGDGPADAEVVFIGEAPGKKEDEAGLPFVGAAGKFLNEMLAGIGLARSDVYITNIVKYRPPNNRDPLPEEKKAFLPYLQMQLEVIKPKLIVALGRHAASCFLPDIQISLEHGRPKRLKLNFHSGEPFEVVLLPLYHPAAALYNGSMRAVLQADFTAIPAIIKKINLNKKPLKV